MVYAPRTWGTEMEYLIQQILNGVTIGAVYASLGLALVLIYRTTNIANFAQGEMATFSAFLTWQLTQWGIPIVFSIGSAYQRRENSRLGHLGSDSGAGKACRQRDAADCRAE